MVIAIFDHVITSQSIRFINSHKSEKRYTETYLYFWFYWTVNRLILLKQSVPVISKSMKKKKFWFTLSILFLSSFHTLMLARLHMFVFALLCGRTLSEQSNKKWMNSSEFMDRTMFIEHIIQLSSLIRCGKRICIDDCLIFFFSFNIYIDLYSPYCETF